MESGLLSTFHDDHCDGNLSKYDNLWSDGNETMGLQLSETLHGILPISATEGSSHFFETELEHRITHSDSNDFQENIDELNQCKEEEGAYFLENFDVDDEDISDSMSPSIEIISVDPNCDFTSPVTIDDADGDSDCSDDDSTETNSDRCSSRSSQYSTESSIADYESHSSDDDDNVDVKDSYLDSQIDLKNFDLASYITLDSYESKTAGLQVNSAVNLIDVNNIKIEAKSDSETEAIIDIETVHENEEDVKPFLLRNQQQIVNYNLNGDFNEVQVDDTKHDPSWSPNRNKTIKMAKGRNAKPVKNKKNNLISQCNRMLNGSSCTNKAKPHVVLDRKKYGLGKGKDISMCKKPKISDSSSDSDTANQCNLRNSKMKQPNGAIVSNSEVQKELNNSSIVQCIKTQVEIKVESQELVAKTEPEINVKTEDVKNDDPIEVSPVDSSTTTSPVAPIKRKLNLEEYKRRRENQLIGDTKIKKCILYDPVPLQIPIKKEDTNKTNTTVSQKPVGNNEKPTTNSIGKGPKLDAGFTDPISEAKNKVLRMQQLKKAAQAKRIDSAVSAKVGPVMPILPLEQICNNGSKPCDNEQTKINPEYEEIIIVSASCNTDITLPPAFDSLTPTSVVNSTNGTIRTIIKSSTLLSDINNTIKKVNTTKISSNSLLSSIQDVVLKKSTTTLLNGVAATQKSPNIGVSPPSQFSPQKPEMSHSEQAASSTESVENKQRNCVKDIEHGEDKIIMHLRKDRIRKKAFSIAIQTDSLPQFPPLTLLLSKSRGATSSSQTINPEKKQRRKRHYRSRRSCSQSSDGGGGGNVGDHAYSSRSHHHHIRYRSSVSSQGTNRSMSPQQQHQHSSRYSHCYAAASRHSISPYRKIRRISSRMKSAANTSSDSEVDRRGRSRERRNRRYSSSHSSSSSSSSSGSSGSDSESTSSCRSRSRTSRSRTRSRSRYPSNSETNRLTSYRNFSPAVEERRIVYVGRIERETSKEDLKRKFSCYGPIRQITVHYKDTGMKYGFVTYERAQDAYAVIDCSMTDPKINMYDISFGGRRAFCRATYADLDGAATNSLQDLPYSMPPTAARVAPTYEDDSFESLLQKVKEKLSSTKTTNGSATSSRSVKI